MKRNKNAIAVGYLGSGPDATVVVNVSSGIAGTTAHPETFISTAATVALTQTKLYLHRLDRAGRDGWSSSDRVQKHEARGAGDPVRDLSNQVTAICAGNMASC